MDNDVKQAIRVACAARSYIFNWGSRQYFSVAIGIGYGGKSRCAIDGTHNTSDKSCTIAQQIREWVDGRRSLDSFNLPRVP